MKKNFIFKRVLTLVLAVMMLVTAAPVGLLAKGEPTIFDNSKIVNNKVPVKVAKPAEGQTAKDLIKNPDQPAIYTLRTDFKVQRGEKYQVDYQPYIASVGEAAIQTEKNKVNKTMDLPDIAGYEKPQENFTIDYDTVKNAADGKNKTGDDTNGLRYSANKEFNYAAKSNKIKIKHVFQDLEDFTKYTNPNGSVGDEGALITTQNGNTGSTMQASPLSETDPRRKGFIPEAEYINMQVPENAENFVLEYRYNRAHYDVVFDTQGGTPLPTRTLYYEQVIPKIADADVPTKVGGDFLGWKPSVELKTKDGKTFKANEIIAVGTGQAIEKLDNNLIMPASEVTFTAVWKDKDKANYAIQFWAEKADHADGASLADKYDFIGTRVYKDKDTGMRPDLDNEPVKDIVFPDLDHARLKKIWAGARFNRGKDLYLNKFYVYNQALTHEQNKDPENVNLVKKVDSTGRTVYNIYYDRQVYELYFTKSNIENSFYPEIWGYDEAQGKVVKKGGPGNLYHYKARFNQLMLGWPNDAMQTKGFDKDMQSFGWGPNYVKPQWPEHLDTPPYRLNADQFLDIEKYDEKGGYVKTIDKGDGTSINLPWYDFTTLSFGIKQAEGSMPHHMDFWMDGFKPGETIIRYDLYRSKADTNSDTYAPKYPKVQGFTPYGYKPGGPWPKIVEGNQENGRVDGDGIDALNDERKAVTPFPAKTYTVFGDELPVGKMRFISAFFNNADEFGDPDGWDGFDTNGYLRFKYTRNKYPLRFNYDPSVIKGDNEFGPTNQLQTFYEFPLKALSPKVDTTDEYKKDKPANLLDNPENLKTLGLKDLVFTDTDGKLKVKRPDNLSDQMVFKGWALDPAGTKLIWENPGEKMPSHPVNLYAKWGEPDYQWKVTFDPNGGSLNSIDKTKVTQKRKTIQVGDKGQEETKTFAQKEKNEGDKQVFTVIQRQKLVEPKKPTRKGYDFMGWEIIHYKKNAKGDYTDEIDNSYRETYKVPELYSFGNDVVAPVYLKAIWVPNDRVDVKVVHHFLSLDLSEETKEPLKETLASKRAGYLVAASGDKQNEEKILATHEELTEKLTGDLKTLYEEYNKRVGANNTYFQTFKVEPEKIDDGSGNLVDNPKFKDNVFHFFYRPFRTRDYKVNYIDERYKSKVEDFFKGLKLEDINKIKNGDDYKNADDKGKEAILLAANEGNKEKFEAKRADFEKLIKEYQIIDPEAVSNGNRHYDARNYRQIPGWVLAKDEKPQQQLFFDVNEKTNEFLGINGTGADQVFFYYKDVRVIETKKDAPVPDGYVRVTYKADKGGAFTDKDGNSKTELYYDVIKGLKSDLLPEPKELEEGKEKEAGKYYVTPETGKKFIKWDEKPLLNKNTIVDNDTKDFYVFTAKFEWSGLSASGLVRTEAFKDPENKWTNDFAPTIDQLKSQLVWMEKGVKKDLPTGAVIKLYDEAGTELTSDDQVYKLVNEKKAADKDELVRTVNVKAKVTFTDGKDPQELDIPIKVYKNVYEALNKEGDKPLFLKEAEGKDAKDGGLKEILKDNDGNRYIKVTIKPNKDFTNKDDKVYYVNPNAWVEIPNDSNGTAALINWTADKVGQNENNAANGKFDFAKRHKFTEDTVISPRLSQTSELVVHESYKDSKNKWVNNFIDKELTDANLKAAIQVKNDKAKALGDGDTVTIVDDAGEPYANVDALKAALYEKLKEKDDDGKVSRKEDIKVKVTFANGEVQTLTVPVKVIKNIYEAKTKTGKPDYVPANYVKVTLDPTTKAKDPQKYFYYVNPDAKVLIPGKDPEGVKEDFTGWTMKADSATGAGTSYKLNDRHQFAEDSTIIAQYGQGKVRIKYVDDGGKEIDSKYHIDGVDYPKEKIGKLGDNIPDPANNQDAEKAAAPKFKGYIISDVIVDKKPANYTDPATATITYTYYKKLTADTPSNLNPYFSVIFDANTGEFGSDPKDKKTVYVYFNGNDATVEKVTFKEVREEVEEKYGKPSKANESFLEWQDKAKSGSAVADNYEIQFKGWDWEADPNNGYVPETFYAAYGKASALVKYLDLNGKPIADEFKIDGVEYPTEKAGTADEAIASDVFTATTAPKFTGYKFNRIELNPKDGKYALSNKATIKIYYEKDLDVIPAKDGNGNPNKKPDGYVEVKFVPTANAKDDTEKIFYVNPKKDVTIPIANPEAKATFSFKEWKIGDVTTGTTYNPGTPKKFTDPTTVITATYESSKNIIPYDPSATDPMVRPDGYVRVTFAADKGLTLTEQKAYYVKKNAGIRLADTALVKPAYEAQTGYEFEKWDKEDTLEITTDITVTAKATVLKDVDTVEHPNYVKVTFKADTNGVIKENGNKVDEKVYYVNPTKYVHLTAPTPVGNTGYDFAAWSSDKATGDFSLANFVNYKENTTITAKFNQKDAVYPKLEGTTKPAGYVEVTFKVTGTEGSIAKSEITTYYVDPTRKVSLKAPKTIAGTGFIFDKWRLGPNPTDQIIKPAEEKQYTTNTTIYGSFTKLKDVIPATNEDETPNLQPVDYVAVLFIGGDHANKVDGQILYYVNPKAKPVKTIGKLTKPTVIPDTGWKYKGWDTADTTEITDYMFVVAQYEELKDVIPKTTNDDSEKPAGYVTVTFKAGDHGKLDGITEKVYYVNPAKYVKLDAPNTVPDNGYEFVSWKSDSKVFSLDNFIRYEKNTTITANFNLKKKVIPKTKPDGTENAKPAGFVDVNFVIEGQGGVIEANQVITYFVKKGEAVTINPPKTKADTGYEFDKWDKDTTTPTAYTDDVTTVKGKFTKLNDIIPSKNPDNTLNAKPEGYVTVQFLKGEHGVLDGKTTFYVNPKAGKTLADLKPENNIKVVPSPTYKFAKWDKDLTTNITGDINVTAEYTSLPDIIKAGPKDTAPAGYVVIIFETDGRGKITGNPAYEDSTNPAKNETEIVYFVNPKKGVKLAELAPGVKPEADQLAIPSTTPDDPDKYIFDQWRKDIDKDAPIIRGRVHIAMFKPKEVTLTYDASGATGDVPPVLTVDYGTDVRLAGKGDLAKKDSRFKGWKIGDKIYQAGDPINLKENTTAYAQWDNDENIIEYNPVDNPTTKPDDTYVRVRFAVEDGLKLKEQKAYYVKKDAHITLDQLNKPTYDVKTGYKFEKWDKEDTLEIKEDDILVTAKAIKLDNVVPEKDEHGTANEKPTGYKEVTFVVKTGDESKGSITGVNKFYVNPTEFVTINPPATKAETGFEFGAWDYDTTRPTVYDKDVTTITGSFNGLKDIIPNKNPDGTENKKPEGYKTVTFVIEGQGGSFVKDEVTVYYVNPAEKVTVPQPQTLAETGYKFDKWDFDTTTKAKYTEDKTVKGNFTKLEDIVDGSNPRPDGYVTVTFDKGEHGTLKGQKVYYVNPNANKTIGDIEIVKPKVTAETGWKQKAAPNAWDKEDTTLIKGPDVILVKAQYDPIDDVVPKDNPQGGENKQPEGYITVTFSTEVNGKIKDTADTTKVVYVNPNKALVLRPFAPTVDPNTGFDFADWDTSIDKAIQYKDKDVIKALYNAKGDVIPQERTDGSDQPAGYLKVMFAKGEHGELSGQTVYYVNPNKKVTVTAPTVNASVGWKFTDWDKALTQKFTAEITTITAKYDPLNDIIPQENTNGSDRPSGYITVTFKPDANGSLSGNTVYYVKPNVEVNLTDTAKNITKNPNTGYTADGGKWKNNDSKKLNDIFANDTEFVFNFEELKDVIEKIDENTKKPDGYVKVTLKPTDKARDSKEIVYFVNPLKDVTITETPVGKEMDINGNVSSFNFIGWTVTRGTINSWTGPSVSDKFIQETEITAKYEFKWINIIQEPIPKDNAVTAKGDVPNPEDLIKNIPGSPEKPLPDGTKITYEEEPKVDEAGNVTAKVKVEYPSGATTIVDVPLTVVDNVVPQIGNDKPLVPESYIKVTVDTTDNATENTKYVKIFWVKPKVQVTLDGIYEPIGKDIVEDTEKGKVTKPNKFLKWTLLGSNPLEEYTVVNNTITASFEKDSTIIANYKNVENIEPKGKYNLWFALNSDPDPKDFIKNVYDDSKPDTAGTLPPGTKFAFEPGIKPKTDEAGGYTATIVVTYPNGEVKDIKVNYNVTGDVVEQEPGKDKPSVPDKFVRVIVSSDELADGVTVDPLVEPDKVVEKAVEDSKISKVYWVDSTKVVTIPVEGRKIVGIKDNADHRQWIFDHWQGVTIEKKNYGDNEITGEFPPLTPQQPAETTYYVLAKYRKDDVPVPSAEYVVTEVGVYPSEQQYRDVITAPEGKAIDKTEVLSRPDVSRPGLTKATIRVTYTDGTQAEVVVMVYVQERPYPEIIYRDRIVEKEKIVEKIVKVGENDELLKEIRYMQGYNGKFRPYDGLTRAEAAQILANALKADGYRYDANYALSYSDVGSKWYTDAVRVVTQAGVFQGYSDGTFRPQSKITRAEWVATLRRFQDLKEANGNTMMLRSNHWATAEVEAAYEAGWLGVYQNGIAKFDADKPITRQEVAYVSNRAFRRVLDKVYLKRSVNTLLTYKDINPSMPLYEDILCASNTLLTDNRYYKANTVVMDNLTFNIVTDYLRIQQKKFQYNVIR